MKNLYRSRKDRIISGVCGGIGKLLGIDPVIIRIIWVALIFTFGFGFLAYIIAWVIIPAEPIESENTSPQQQPKEGRTDIFESNPTMQANAGIDRKATLAIGIVIVMIGIFALFSSVFGIAGWIISFLSKAFWPLLLIMVGIIIIYYYWKKR